MKTSHFIFTAALAITGTWLVACSKKPGTPPQISQAAISGGPNLAAANASQSAKTYAMNGKAGYKSQPQGPRYNAQGELINSLNAPSNQTYYFSFDSNRVYNSAFQALNAQANFLASHPNATVRLEGNADNRGSREYNIGLGWRRDQSVARLLEQQGVRPKQIDMVSYGKERPAVFGDNERDWQLNRRVHLVYEAY